MVWTMNCMCEETTPAFICVSVAVGNFLLTVTSALLLLLKLLCQQEWSLIHKEPSCALGEPGAYFGLPLSYLNPLWKGFSVADSSDVSSSCGHTAWWPRRAMAGLCNGKDGAQVLRLQGLFCSSGRWIFLPICCSVYLTSAVKSNGSRVFFFPIFFYNVLFFIFLFYKYVISPPFLPLGCWMAWVFLTTVLKSDSDNSRGAPVGWGRLGNRCFLTTGEMLVIFLPWPIPRTKSLK